VVKSNRIVVIGGGAVGVELVGELALDYPNKSQPDAQQGTNLG